MSQEQASVTIERQLDLLNDRMKETSATANSFAGRFIFGGLGAILALLNVDLVVLRDVRIVDVPFGLLAGLGALVLVLASLYFGSVTRQYRGFRESHRKLKYKFELTLHALLLEATPAEYGAALECDLDDGRSGREGGDRDGDRNDDQSVPEPSYPDDADFASVAEYLYAHHRVRLAKLKARRDPLRSTAMLMVTLAVVLRVVGFVVAGAGDAAVGSSGG